MSGPPEDLDREGIEMGRKFLEEAVWGTEVRGGDYPIPGSKQLAGVVLLSGLVNIPRVKEMLEEGAAIQIEMNKKSRRKDRRPQQLQEAVETVNRPGKNLQKRIETLKNPPPS